MTAAPADRNALVFSETQRFTQPWLWLLILGIAAWSWHGAYRQIVLQSGKRVPIGTQQPDRLSAAIRDRMER